jgi:hypothetical protein
MKRVTKELGEIIWRVEKHSGIKLPKVSVEEDSTLRTKPRHYSAMSTHSPWVLYVHPELKDQQITRIRGILSHELGHLADFAGFYDVAENCPELRADLIAEEMLGWIIYYDYEDIQRAGPGASGVSQRPMKLR